MWTTKRIVIVVGGVLLFSFFFAFYNRLLGDIDGLPPLPIKYLPQKGENVPSPPGPDSTDIKFNESFPKEKDKEFCPETTWPIKVFLGSRGLGLAAEKFIIEPDGKVKLTPFSLCIYPKTRTEGKFPEINTIQCKVAIFTLDRPVKDLMELANRKIVKLELRGDEGVKFVNNRGTQTKTDDIEVTIKNAPVFYDETLNLIWSDGLVQLVERAIPNPTEVYGTGFELHLVRESSNKQEKNAGKAKGEGVSGVASLALLSKVHMILYVDPRSGFLADPQAKDPGPKLSVSRDTANGGRKTVAPPEKCI